MSYLSHENVTVLLLSLGLLLGTARLFGEIARRLGQPAVIGELLAGIVLGPTVLGTLWPRGAGWIFPTEGATPVALEGLTTVSITLFLLIAGMEVDLSTIWRRRVAAFWIGVGGMAAPFALGLGVALLAPGLMGAVKNDLGGLIFALFFATALAISALPVVAKMLLDLHLFRTEIGMTIIAAVVLNDLCGWLIFALILAMMGHETGAGFPVWGTVALTLVFVAVMFTVGRWAIDRSLPWVQAHTSWPGGVLGYAMVLGVLCAAFTEWLGVHAIFGAFLLGVALGDSRHLRPNTRATIDHFVSFIFAPLFFASVGLRMNFAAHFDLGLVVTVVALATVGKLAGTVGPARWLGFERKEAWAIGFGMNARGAMEIILGLLALQAGLIGERLFVALVVMALVTSMTSGVLMQWVLGRPKIVSFVEFAGARMFAARMRAADRRAAVETLAGLAAEQAGLTAERLTEMTMAREGVMGSAIGNGVAVPHARVAGLKAPVVAVGLAPGGVDWDAADGAPVQLMVMLVTPSESPQLQLELLASVARLLHDRQTVARLVTSATWTEFLAAINAEGSAGGAAASSASHAGA